MLQVLDDGRITDSQGRTVDFKNTIIIMTSNIGSTYLLDGIDENGGIKQETEELVMNDLRGHFRPEFLNRLDEIILFKAAHKRQYRQYHSSADCRRQQTSGRQGIAGTSDRCGRKLYYRTRL